MDGNCSIVSIVALFKEMTVNPGQQKVDWNTEYDSMQN